MTDTGCDPHGSGPPAEPEPMDGLGPPGGCPSRGPSERYSIVLKWSDEDQAFIGRVPELPGCCFHGDTRADAMGEAASAIAAWVEAALAAGNPIPAAVALSNADAPQWVGLHAFDGLTDRQLCAHSSVLALGDDDQLDLPRRAEFWRSPTEFGAVEEWATWTLLSEASPFSNLSLAGLRALVREYGRLAVERDPRAAGLAPAPKTEGQAS